MPRDALTVIRLDWLGRCCLKCHFHYSTHELNIKYELNLLIDVPLVRSETDWPYDLAPVV